MSTEMEPAGPTEPKAGTDSLNEDDLRHLEAMKHCRHELLKEAIVQLITWLEDDTLEIMRDTRTMGIAFDAKDCEALRGQIEKARIALERAEAAAPEPKPEPNPRPVAICPSCGAEDNNPYTDAQGNRMRACGRCMIQWRESWAEPASPERAFMSVAGAEELFLHWKLINFGSGPRNKYTARQCMDFANYAQAALEHERVKSQVAPMDGGVMQPAKPKNF